MRILFALLLCTGALLAQSVDSFKPVCGAEGDLVLIRGADFGAEPSVSFDGTAASVIKSNAEAILVRVPEGATSGKISVDGAESADDFTVLPDGSPVVHYVSADKATPGQRIVLIGRRLKDTQVQFVDAGSVAATVDLKGGRRFGWLTVPEDLATGVTYTLKIVGDGVDSGDCSPTLEVVEPGEPTITAITPEGALPGRHVVIEGSDLRPGGPVLVTWVKGESELKAFGFSNGFGKVFSHVPFRADAGGTYDVTVVLGGDAKTNTVSYDVGTPGAPEITALKPDAGPAGSFFRIEGDNLFSFGQRPKVEMKKGDTVLDIDVFGALPAFGNLPQALLARVPHDAADGDYDVTVTVGDQTSNAKTFTVGELPLTATSLAPDHGNADRRFNHAVSIEGTGFGWFGSGKIEVVWINGDGQERAGFVVFRTDRYLRVFPPPELDAGEYDVVVRRGEDEATAGVYTAE